jgi:hypothetical protein
VGLGHDAARRAPGPHRKSPVHAFAGDAAHPRKGPDPVTLQLFYSEKAAANEPQFRIYAQRVRELLEEVAAKSKGKITLKVVDPEPFSDAEKKRRATG